MSWLLAFGFTHAVEVPVALLLTRDRPPLRVAAAVLLGTTLTHPLLWYVLPGAFDEYWTWIAVSEVGICLAEGALLAALAPLPPLRALSIALRTNALSYLGGLLLQIAGLWPAT